MSTKASPRHEEPSLSPSTATATAIDCDALDAYLHSHVEGYAGPLALARFPGGQSNPTYRLSTPGQTYVMRTKPGPVARLLPSAHAIEREYLSLIHI